MRQRSRELNIATGYAERIWSRVSSHPTGPIGSHTVSDVWTSTDEIHPYPYVAEGSLQLSQRKTQYARLSGTRKISYFHNRGERIPLKGSAPAGRGIAKPLNDQKAEAVLKAMNFGSKPIVDLPLALAELKDLPRMIRNFRDIARFESKASDAYLNYQFGVNPMVNDALELLRLQRQLSEQFRRVRNAVRRGSISGRLSTVSSPAGDLETFGTQALPGVAYQRVREKVISHKAEAWFSAKVSPKGWSLSDRDDLLNPVAGLGLDRGRLSTLWNLIPWSFLVDYFTNVGDLVDRSDNQFPWNVESVCIMNRLTTRIQITWEEYRKLHNVVYVPGSAIHTFKHRDVVGSVTGFRILPVLSQKQATNILALAASMKRR